MANSSPPSTSSLTDGTTPPTTTPTTTPSPHPKGRLAIAQFPNNITNIKPTDYKWVKSSSIHDLCHKGKNNEQPKQAVLWLVGEVDEHTLNDSTPYGSWSMTIRLSSASDNALTTLLLTGPHKTDYAAPNLYTLAKVSAKVKSVVEDLEEMGEDPISLLVADQPYPFTYDGTSLTADWSLPDHGFDYSHFKNRSWVGVEVSVLAYRMGPLNQPGYSLHMRALYHLGPSTTPPPTTPMKRKGGCLVSPRRRKGALFDADTSKTA